MKIMRVVSILTLLALSLASAHPATAQTAGPAASGYYYFLLVDGFTKYVNFSGSTDPRGNTSGSMYFSDQAAIPDVDDPENPGSGGTPPQFYANVTFNGLSVQGNRALMNGTVTSSSHRTYYGKFAQLVVEDNGGSQRNPDNLTWQFCKPSPGGWIPSDAERSFDNGAYLSWWATDEEWPGDVGIPSKSVIPGQDRTCPSLALPVYNLVDLVAWYGRMVVTP
jgi:hypothetical protein